jgi:signal peptidase I
MTDDPQQPSDDQPRTPLWERPAPTTPPVSNGWARPPAAATTEAPTEAAIPAVAAEPEVDEPLLTTATTTGAKHRKRRKPRSAMRSAIEWGAVIVGALVVALVVKTFLFQAFYIPSASMEPTLKKGDRVLVNKLSYDLHDIHRGDIVVFELPKDKIGPDGIKDLIKRAIGLPGDVIETRDGIVYINGEKLDEPWLPKGVTTNKPPIPKQTVPDGTIFVLGDNRDNSADSRYATRGPIPIDTVVGRAFVQVWPPSDIGGL